MLHKFCKLQLHHKLGFCKSHKDNNYFLVVHDKRKSVNALISLRWGNSQEALLRDFKIIGSSQLALESVKGFPRSDLCPLLNKRHQMFFKPVVGEYTFRHLN